jgi:cell wall-associated NlpC family hydrolase
MSRLRARRQLFAVGLSIVIAAPVGAIAATSAVASDSGGGGFVLLRRGDDGPRVALTQRALKVKPVNGHFNPETKHKVRRFQDHRHFEVTGVVNERTMNALRRKWENIQDAREKWRHKYHRIMRVARNQKGDPYVYGADGPNAFDCSGYTKFVYAKATSIHLEHLATAQFRKGKRIVRKHARPGDLVFMYSGGSIYHASIYAGHGKIWHASRPGTNVKKDPIWTNKVYFARMFPKP